MDYLTSVICLVFNLALAIVPNQGQSFKSEAKGLFVMLGSNITIYCKVDNLGAKNVIWSHDVAFLSMNHMVIGGDTNRLKVRGKYNLKITNITLADEGKYICQVTSIPPITQVNFINVTVPPTVQVVNDSTDIEATLRENVTLQCTATGKPAPNITWSRDGGLLPCGKEYLEGDTITLTSLQYDDGGVYTCTAFNGYGEPAEDTIRIRVYYPPKIHSKVKKLYTGPGVRTKIPCIVSGQPQPLVEWHHNGSTLNLRDLPEHMEMLYEQKGFKSDFSLVIRGVQDRDLGSYVCKVKSTKGDDTHKVTLTAAPGDVGITSDSTGNFSRVYDLTWEVQSFVVPSKYQLMYREINETFEGDWTEKDIDVNSQMGTIEHSQTERIGNLTPDTQYEVSMRAYNNYGWGETSQKFVFTTNLHDDSNAAVSLLPWQLLLLFTLISVIYLS